MLTIDRWRNWRPSPEKFEDSPGCELTKPTEAPSVSFDGSTSEQMQNFSDVPPDHDPAAWREDFIHWAMERCALRDDHEDSQSVASLLLDFAEWAIDHDAVPCQRAVFEQLLSDAGFPLRDGMAAGLVLIADLEAVLHWQGVCDGTNEVDPVLSPLRSRAAGQRARVRSAGGVAADVQVRRRVAAGGGFGDGLHGAER